MVRLFTGLCLLSCASCSHRQSNATAAAPSSKGANPPMMSVVVVPQRTFTGAGIQFNYPGDWTPATGQTALFAITGPSDSTNPKSVPSLNLDVPKLPWHLPGMITVNMVASGYISDLKKNQIHDAVVEEQCPLSICGETARRVTCTGHIDGKPTTDVAVFLVHADHVYIFSADSDKQGCDCARKTLDEAVASMQWVK